MKNQLYPVYPDYLARATWLHKITFFCALLFILNGCTMFGAKESGIALSPQDWKSRSSEPLTTLESYYAKHQELPKRSDLIACAAGGQMAMSGEGTAPVSVFFYPKAGATDIRIFEAESIETDTLDIANFKEKRWPVQPVFNGYLRRYATDYQKKETWMVITCLTADTLHTSRMIHLKIGSQPTIVDMDGIAWEKDTTGLNFRWPGDSLDSSAEPSGADLADLADRAGPNDPNDAVYFEVVSDEAGNLISGTYTREPQFTFYDTKNVFINIHETDPPPSLKSGLKYEFMVMAVSKDNWVNRILKKKFVAPVQN